MKWTTFQNVGFAQIGPARIWCRFVTIDSEAREGFCGNIRQIRGSSWGGQPTFTLWIDPKAEIAIESVAGGNVLMLSDIDEKMIPMDSGVRIVAGEISVELSPDNIREPIVIEELDRDSYPFGREVDLMIAKYAGGQNYPHTEYRPLAFLTGK